MIAPPATPVTNVAEVRDLRAYYVTETSNVQRTVRAVDGISLQIQEGEVYGIAGESGCGKSTLLKVLLGMVTPPLSIVGGSVHYRVDGRDVDILALSESERRAMRWSVVSYIPQGSMHVLNPVRKIRDTFRDFIAAHKPSWVRQTDEHVRGYLNDLGLPERVLGAYPHHLSGGMRQRVTIALATILSPRLILADEPTTALDHAPSGCRFHPRCPYAMEVCKTVVPPLMEVRPGHRVACHLVNPPNGSAAHAVG